MASINASHFARAMREARRQCMPGTSDEDLAEAAADILDEWQRESIHNPPYDSPHIEAGVHNCDDWGTGEGRYHGRM